MGQSSITGSEVIQLDGRIFNDVADGDFIQIVFPNDMSVTKTSKNGNSMHAENPMGRQAEVTLRVLLGSPDDKYLNSRLSEQNNNYASFIFLAGQYTKRTGDGSGNLSSTIYQLSGGTFKKRVEGRSSAEGNIEQTIAVYIMNFADASGRSIQ